MNPLAVHSTQEIDVLIIFKTYIKIILYENGKTWLRLLFTRKVVSQYDAKMSVVQSY